MRAAVYARVSTTRQAQAQGIEQQLDRLRAAAAERGWELVPGGATWLKVVLNNADPYAPGYWVGAGDMAFDCNAV